MRRSLCLISESKSNLRTTKKKEESSDDDANEDEEEEEQPAQPVAQIKWPAYVAPRLDYILMDYDKSMF
jgi:hypothetical protein